MTKELFEKAKFGDRFVTRGGQEALFLRLTENSEWQFADFYVKDWGLIRVNRENGKCLNESDIENDIVGKTPSLSSELDEAAEKYAIQGHKNHTSVNYINTYIEGKRIGFKAGAEWMAGQGITVECGVRVYPTLDEEPHPWVSLYRNGISCDSIKDIPELETLGFKDGDNAIVTIRKKQQGESLKEKENEKAI